MKKPIYIALIVVLFGIESIAQNQVGINTSTPDASSVLEVQSTTKGIRIPRMSSGQRRNISNPADGLWVYETNSDTYWYAVSGNWVELISGGSIPDGIGDGDGDTKIFTEFTADNDQIRFFINGTEHFRMRPRRIDVVNTGNSIFMGGFAGAADDLSNNQNVFVGHSSGRNNITGVRNVAFGALSLLNLLSNNDNTAIGYRSSEGFQDARRNVAIGTNTLLANVSTDNHVAIGYQCLQSHNDRFNNVGIGRQSLTSSMDGRSNVAIGNLSLNSGTSVSFAVAVGDEAGAQVSNNRGIYLGFEAGSETTSGNRLFIDNSSTANPLIFGDYSADAIVINDHLRVMQDITYVGTLTDISDRRLKENLIPLESTLDKLIALGVYRYNLKSNNGEREIGLMAQEVQKQFPYAVRTIDHNNGFLGVDYFQLIPIVLKAEQEQSEKLRTNAKRLDQMELDLNKLQEKLNALKEQERATSMK